MLSSESRSVCLTFQRRVRFSTTDQLFHECRGLAALLPQYLQWYDIRESDAESDSEGETVEDEDEDSDNELMLTDVTAFILRALERHRDQLT